MKLEIRFDCLSYFVPSVILSLFRLPFIAKICAENAFAHLSDYVPWVADGARKTTFLSSCVSRSDNGGNVILYV